MAVTLLEVILDKMFLVGVNCTSQYQLRVWREDMAAMAVTLLEVTVKSTFAVDIHCTH